MASCKTRDTCTFQKLPEPVKYAFTILRKIINDVFGVEINGISALSRWI